MLQGSLFNNNLQTNNNSSSTIQSKTILLPANLPSERNQQKKKEKKKNFGPLQKKQQNKTFLSFFSLHFFDRDPSRMNGAELSTDDGGGGRGTVESGSSSSDTNFQRKIQELQVSCSFFFSTNP